MAFGLIGTIISALSGPLGTVADRYFDNVDDKEAFKNSVELEILKNQKNITDQAGNIILAEAKSESWLTSSWRPLMMVIFVAVIAIQVLIVPYFLTPFLWLIGVPLPELMPIPDQVWNLLTIGIGGYVGGRSIEKATKSISEVVAKSKKSLDDF